MRVIFLPASCSCAMDEVERHLRPEKLQHEDFEGLLGSSRATYPNHFRTNFASSGVSGVDLRASTTVFKILRSFWGPPEALILTIFGPIAPLRASVVSN